MGEPSGQGREVGDARSRISDAIVDVVLERGFPATTLEMVLERAGCSAAEFKRHFSDLEDCGLQLLAGYSDDFIAQVEAAYSGQDSWRDALRAAGYAAARWQREHPRELRFGALELLWSGEMARVRIEATIEHFTDMVDAGRHELDDPDSVPRSTAEALIGQTAMMMTKWLEQEGATGEYQPKKFPDAYIQQVMYMAVLPYLGQEAAEEELEIPPPPDLNNDPNTPF